MSGALGVGVFVGLFDRALSFATRLMDKTPDYPDSKRDAFTKLRLSYEAESKKRYPERDDDFLLNLRDELNIRMDEFDHHLAKSTAAPTEKKP